MKNVVYYSSLALLWVTIHILTGVILIAFGVVAASSPYALVIAVLIPEVWLFSVGLAMFTRRVLAKKILHKENSYSKVIPTVLTALGAVMIIANIVLTAIQENKTDETTPISTPKIAKNNNIAADDNEENRKDLLLIKTILDFKAGLN